MNLPHWGSEGQEYKERILNDDFNWLVSFVSFVFVFLYVLGSFTPYLLLEFREEEEKAKNGRSPSRKSSNKDWQWWIHPAECFVQERERTPLCSPYDSTEVIIQVWDTNHQMQDMYLARAFYNIIKIWRCLKYDNNKHSINYKDAQRCVHQQTCKNILAA